MHDERARTYLMTIFHMKSKNACKLVSIFIWNVHKTNKTYLVANTKCTSKPLRGASTHLVFDVVVGRWWFWRWWPYFIWNWKMPVKMQCVGEYFIWNERKNKIKRTWLRIPSASRSPSGGLRRTWYSMLLLGGGGFGSGSKNRHGVGCVDGQVAGEGIFVDFRPRVVKFPRPLFA